MRIGIVAGEYPPMIGGVGAYSRIFAAELARQNHQVYVFSASGAASPDDAVTLTAAVTHWGLGSLRQIRRWAAENSLDVVSFQYQTAAYAMSPFVHFLPDALRPIPCVTTFHDLRYPYLFPKAGPVRNWIVMRLACASGGVIATNHEDAARLAHLRWHRLIPIGSNIAHHLPAGCEPQNWRERAGAQPGDFLIAFFGLLNHSKGLDMLLRAVASLRQMRIPARLLLIGGGAGSSDPTNTAFASEIETLIDQLELRPFVHQTGFLEEQAVSALLTASDTVALPFLDGASYRRGSLMAAIRCGCAIVTTQPQIDIPAFIQDANMRFVPRGDAEALAVGLRGLYEDPALRQRLSAGAAALAQQFEWPQIVRLCVDFYQQVIEAA
jgi:glycosyltransferase involved in cell wall biosynthesis